MSSQVYKSFQKLKTMCEENLIVTGLSTHFTANDHFPTTESQKFYFLILLFR